MRSRLNQIMGIDDRATLEQQEECLNDFFNLSKEGFFRDQREDKHKLKLDAWQLLSPYRGGVAGTLLANRIVREQYRANSYPESRFDKPWHGSDGSVFAHSDKIIRVTNYYEWDDELKSKTLKLSNGSIEVLCSNKKWRLASFPEADAPFFWNNFDEDDFEPAYAISVHKSQGSEFGEEFVIVPERRALL